MDGRFKRSEAESKIALLMDKNSLKTLLPARVYSNQLYKNQCFDRAGRLLPAVLTVFLNTSESMNLRIVFALALFCCFESFGQNFTTINYSISEGLPSSEVYEVFHD